MAQQFIHVRVEAAQKRDAEKILNSLGLTMTTGIHLFLSSIIRNKGLPFEIKQSREDLLGYEVAELERRYRKAVADATARSHADGFPVALYDKDKKRPFLEYPDGRREYTDG
jgi:addiction module RelB/DinJ family antitoxin